MKPYWPVRKIRRVLGLCPWCATKMEKGLAGMFLNGWTGCPRGHYGEEFVWAAGGTVVYEDKGKVLPGLVKPPEVVS